MARWQQLNFNGGELSPKAQGRPDVAWYSKGLKECTNFIPEAVGAATFRAGTSFVTATKDSSKASALMEFEYSKSQSYIVELGDQYARFYQNRSQILSGGSPYEISTPYAPGDVAALQGLQINDARFIFHQAYSPRSLNRLGTTNWTLTSLSFAPAPLATENNSAVTLNPSAVTGTITVTASAATFTAAHIGSQWEISQNISNAYDVWETGVSVSSGDVRRYDGRVYQSGTTGTTGNRPPTHSEGTRSDGTVNWTYLHSGVGYFEITGYTSSTSVTASVKSRLPATGATVKWRPPVFSGQTGWPVSACILDDRLVIGGQGWVALSVVGDYTNFSRRANGLEVTDDSAIIVPIPGRTVQYVVETEQGVLIGTNSGLLLLRSGSTSATISPTNQTLKFVSSNGAYAAAPVMQDDKIFYIDASSKILRGGGYDLSKDGVMVKDYSLQAAHMLEVGIDKLALQSSPIQVVWGRGSDGILYGMTNYTAEESTGFCRLSLGGVSDSDGTQAMVESMARCTSPDGLYDDLFVMVKRYVDGGVKRYIEFLNRPLGFKGAYTDAVYLDSALSYSGSATATLTGLGHLEGESVMALRNGVPDGPFTVSSGEITLSAETTLAHVGKSYLGRVETLPIVGPQIGMGTTRCMAWIKMLLHRSLGGRIGLGHVNSDKYEEVQFIKGRPMDQAPPLFSGYKTKKLDGDYREEVTVAVEQHLPLPFCLMGLLGNIEAGRE